MTNAPQQPQQPATSDPQLDGWCWAACLAYLFDVPIEATAHCSVAASPDDWREQTDAWLARRGLFWLQVSRPSGRTWPFSPANDVLAIAVGPRVGDGADHSNVMQFYDVSERRFDIEPVYQPGGALARIDGLCFFPPLNPKTISSSA